MNEIDQAVIRAIEMAPAAAPEVDPLEYLEGQKRIAEAEIARSEAALEGLRQEVRDLDRVMAAVRQRREEAKQ